MKKQVFNPANALGRSAMLPRAYLDLKDVTYTQDGSGVQVQHRSLSEVQGHSAKWQMSSARCRAGEHAKCKGVRTLGHGVTAACHCDCHREKERV
jgi:hypothetical protein